MTTIYNPDHTRRLVIELDDDPMNPRTEQDNVASMWCEHRRFLLGDEDAKSELADDIEDPAQEKGIHFEDKYMECPETGEPHHDADKCDKCDEDGEIENPDYNELDSPAEILRVLERVDPDEEYIFRLPLFLYEHGGITMSTGAFGCPWDSGQVGMIFVTREQVIDEGWVGAKRDMPVEEIRDLAHQGMRSEADTYDQYLTGQIYQFKLEVLDTERMKEGEDPEDFDDEPFMWDVEESLGSMWSDDLEEIAQHLPEEDQAWVTK